ncbi:MAG: hypothetical protein PHE53_11375 [Thermoguttaceae bacterium]|nr:hypothetical protein [Thermoguttaceae bacterium]
MGLLSENESVFPYEIRLPCDFGVAKRLLIQISAACSETDNAVNLER